MADINLHEKALADAAVALRENWPAFWIVAQNWPSEYRDRLDAFNKSADAVIAARNQKDAA